MVPLIYSSLQERLDSTPHVAAFGMLSYPLRTAPYEGQGIPDVV